MATYITWKDHYLYSKTFAIESFRVFGAYWMVMVVMAVRADQFLGYGLLSGGHSDDKGRSARCSKAGDRLA